MVPENLTQLSIDELVGNLANDDAVVRETSRGRLVEIGTPEVTRAFVAALIDPRRQVRWEAARGLQSLGDPVAAAALMHAMDDEDEHVRWVAASALVDLDRTGLLTTLSGLIKRAGSVDFCRAAHHVLHELKEYRESVTPVLRALSSSEPAVTAPPAALHAMLALNAFDTPTAAQ